MINFEFMNILFIFCLEEIIENRENMTYDLMLFQT